MTHPKNNTAEKQCVRDKDNVSKVGLLLYIFWGVSQPFPIIVVENSCCDILPFYWIILTNLLTLAKISVTGQNRTPQHY